MNKILLPALFVIIPLMFLGCKKNNDENSSIPFKKISMIIISDDPTLSYEYNSDGKVSKISYEDVGSEIYTYSGNTITISEYFNGDTSIITLSLNSQGYVSKRISDWGETITYEYDNKGYCIKETTTYSSGTANIKNYTYINGNLSTMTETHGKACTSYTYEYYLDKENTIGNEHNGQSFYGKSSKNLLKQCIESGGWAYTYTYDFDQDNYVAKKTTIEYHDNDNYTSWESYIYK